VLSEEAEEGVAFLTGGVDETVEVKVVAALLVDEVGLALAELLVQAGDVAFEGARRRGHGVAVFAVSRRWAVSRPSCSVATRSRRSCATSACVPDLGGVLEVGTFGDFLSCYSETHSIKEQLLPTLDTSALADLPGYGASSDDDSDGDSLTNQQFETQLCERINAAADKVAARHHAETQLRDARSRILSATCLVVIGKHPRPRGSRSCATRSRKITPHAALPWLEEAFALLRASLKNGSGSISGFSARSSLFAP